MSSRGTRFLVYKMNLTCPRRCQLKTEYDLRGQKHRGEKKRKEIFVTAHNKKISINKEVSKKAAELVKKGVVSIFLNRHAAGP